jgi:hypothetical protein
LIDENASGQPAPEPDSSAFHLAHERVTHAHDAYSPPAVHAELPQSHCTWIVGQTVNCHGRSGRHRT